jgi:surface antigen
LIILSNTQESQPYKEKRQKLQNFALKLTSLIFGFSLPLSLLSAVHADTYSAKINSLQSQNSNISAQKQNLLSQQETLSQRIASLQASISDLQVQINAQQAKSDQLKAKIADDEIQIANKKATLGVNLKQMYLDNDMTTFEALVSSKNLSDYTNKEQYRLSVEDKVKEILDQIKALKTQQETILSEQTARQAQLAQNQAEATQLLAMNQQQQAAYDSSISANNVQISQLRAAQAAANARAFVGGIKTGGSGGYPYAYAPWPNSISDPWGMYERQCVSYTAWKIVNSGRHMPFWGGRGNANQWDDDAMAAGIPVDTNPKVGDVAVSNAGTYGHVMYVERVNDNGTIYVSQYNAAWDGQYSEGTRSTGGLVFIHF